jgi:hypothetical protein
MGLFCDLNVHLIRKFKLELNYQKKLMHAAYVYTMEKRKIATSITSNGKPESSILSYIRKIEIS